MSNVDTEMSQIGLNKDEIDTPALLIDLNLMEKNISTMSNFLRDKKAKLRAHTKVHRTPILAHRQIEAGAKGICCQKVAEAEIMVASGIKDVIVTNEIITLTKINRLVALCNYANISVPIDDVDNAKILSKIAQRNGVTLNVLLDIHLGSNRCGVEPGEPALKLAKLVNQLKGIKFNGLMGFEGHISWMEPREKRRSEIERLEGLLVNTSELIKKAGIEVEEISTGSTGTYDVSSGIPEVTEVQAGTYLLMDAVYNQHVPEFECALTVLSTVISKPAGDRAITDAGQMSINTHGMLPIVKGMNGLEVMGVHAENTILKNRGPGKIKVGDAIEIIPSYLDGTVKLHEKFYGIKSNKVESVWKILGRDTSN